MQEVAANTCTYLSPNKMNAIIQALAASTVYPIDVYACASNAGVCMYSRIGYCLDKRKYHSN